MDPSRIAALKWLLEMVGLAFLALGALLLSKIKTKLSKSVKVDALIKDYNVSGTPNAKGRIIRYFTPIYEFEYEGKKYTKEAEIRTEKQPYKEGRTVKLHFDPKSGEITAGNELRMALVMAIIPVVAGLALALYGYFGITVS